ncbi:hypothetical protein DPMN_108831 [Dreissena polymorpha]|uniref:Uncharacterized protein n=1 Tax=Dreissena polymorpha TaxID=45954 RepID=A0A9D4K9V4_DREPO|nr:hypothetical protein DPMN_108831 [Dreissena polymorpha]
MNEETGDFRMRSDYPSIMTRNSPEQETIVRQSPTSQRRRRPSEYHHSEIRLRDLDHMCHR